MGGKAPDRGAKKVGADRSPRKVRALKSVVGLRGPLSAPFRSALSAGGFSPRRFLGFEPLWARRSRAALPREGRGLVFVSRRVLRAGGPKDWLALEEDPAKAQGAPPRGGG